MNQTIIYRSVNAIAVGEYSKIEVQSRKSAADPQKILLNLYLRGYFLNVHSVVKNIFIIIILTKIARNSPGVSRH